MKAAIYIRTNENHKKITSKTAAQLFRLYTYAIDKGYDVSLKHIYSDTGSANTFPRDGVEKLIKGAEAKQFTTVLVTGYDRIARSIPAMAEITLLLERNKVNIKVVS
jgi:DNA invertase Pin-like site-specific DNA recombinase